MNALDNLLNQYRVKGEIELEKKDLLIFAMKLFKEVDLLERDNVGAPGKAAIEYLLNQKYLVIENHKLSRFTQDQLLTEIDAVINKVVTKFRVQRKGKNFYFDEAMQIVIAVPDKLSCTDADQVLANIYAAQQELEALRIQLTRTNLQNTSQTLLMKKAVLDKEQEIQGLKAKLRKFKYFDSVTDQDALYRRSLGEAKKETITGAALGGVVGAHTASNNFKKKVKFDKKRNNFQQANKSLNNAKKEMAGLAGEARHVYNSGLTPNKQKKFDKLVSQMKANNQNQKAYKKAVEKGGKQVVNLSREATKKALKGGLKGAAIGAAAGLGVAAAHKAMNKNESLSSRLFSHLNKLNRIPVNEDDNTSNKITTLYRGIDGVYRYGKLSKYKGALNAIRRNKGLKAASIAGALLLGAAGLSYIIQKAREKGVDRVKGSIRSTQSKARHSSSLTNKDKIAIQNNGNEAIRKLDQLFKGKR